MKILAFDASAAVGAVALTDGDKCVCSQRTQGAHTHSETLLPLAQSALLQAGWSVPDIDLFACAVGPGSFTGVRIAVSLAKGLAFPGDKPCVGVSSLEALAYPLKGFDGVICPMLDARRGNVYNALFKGGKRLCPDRLISMAALEGELAALGETVYLCGDAYDAAKDSFSIHTEHTPEHFRVICGEAVAFVALEKYNAGGSFSVHELRPEYLRPTQAEREREERKS